MISKTDFINLLIKGTLPKITEPDHLIKSITEFIDNDPNTSIRLLKQSIEIESVPLHPLFYAILLSRINGKILDKNSSLYRDIKFGISKLYFDQFYEMTNFIDSKYFGHGLGTFARNICKDTMESWSINNLKFYTENYWYELKYLISKIHPRFVNEFGLVIRNSYNQ